MIWKVFKNNTKLPIIKNIYKAELQYIMPSAVITWHLSGATRYLTRAKMYLLPLINFTTQM